MDNEIMVSIVCAAYNHEPFIAQALESFVNQKTDFKYEVVINDDASTDGTTDIIKAYEKQYPTIIRAIYQDTNLYSQGISPTELMVKASRGKYIATCEGDDFWTDMSKLQKQVEYMESHEECSLCGHANIVVDKNGKFIRERCECQKNSRVDLINEGGYMHYATRLARREVYETFPESLKRKYYSGVAYIYYAHLLGYLYFMEEPMSAWRINDNSVTHSLYLGIEKKREIFKDYINFYDNFDSISNGSFSKGIEKRKKEQMMDLISGYRNQLSKKDFRMIIKTSGFNTLPLKYKIYTFVRSILL